MRNHDSLILAERSSPLIRDSAPPVLFRDAQPKQYRYRAPTAKRDWSWRPQAVRS